MAATSFRIHPNVFTYKQPPPLTLYIHARTRPLKISASNNPPRALRILQSVTRIVSTLSLFLSYAQRRSSPPNSIYTVAEVQRPLRELTLKINASICFNIHRISLRAEMRQKAESCDVVMSMLRGFVAQVVFNNKRVLSF